MDDGVASPLTGGFIKRLDLIDVPAKLDDREYGHEKQWDDEGKLDQGLTSGPALASRAAVVWTNGAHGAPVERDDTANRASRLNVTVVGNQPPTWTKVSNW